MKNQDSKRESKSLEWSERELEKKQYSTIDDYLKAMVQKAEGLIDNNPELALNQFKIILDYLSDNESRLKKQHQVLYQKTLLRATKGVEMSQVKQFLRDAMTHIINLKTITLGMGESWDYQQDTKLVLQEDSQAKRLLARADQYARKLYDKELQKEIWLLDDRRIMESLAARDRISQRRLQLIADTYTWDTSEAQTEVFVFTSCDVLGGKFVYVVTIKNGSKYVITNINATIVSFPHNCMKLSASANRVVSRIEVDGFRNVKFVLHPTKDCVEGKISMVVSYIDHKDRLHTIAPESYIIRSVCDLLQPLESSATEFENGLNALISRNQNLKLNWNAEVLIQKATSILPRMNFYLIDSQTHHVGEMIVGSIRGFAIGKYTGKRVAVTMKITGENEKQESMVEVTIAGDDEAMFPTTIEELTEKMDSWICLECGAKLNPEQIDEISKGAVVQCRYCSHTLTADLYCRRGRRPEAGAVEFVMPSEEKIPQYPSISDELAISEVPSLDRSIVLGVNTLRGCEIVGGKFVYKIKVENQSEYVITNVTTTIIAFPQDCLILDSDEFKSISRIEVKGFRSVEYSFIPTKDCVEGKIVSVVSFVDLNDNIHSLHVEPYTIRSVCDLLKPLESTTNDLERFLNSTEKASEEYTFDWNPQILFKITEHVLCARNFFIVNTEERRIEERYIGIIRGFAEGKYTSNRIAVIVLISGVQEGQVSIARIEVLGNDSSMFPTTIDEVTDSMYSWICLHCGGLLESEEVTQLKANLSIQCKHCGHTLSIELYKA